MNTISHHYRQARQLFVLTATYGDGAAPQSANRFMTRLEAITPPVGTKAAVLGFGDRSFPNFCQFATDVEAAMVAKGWTLSQPGATIDRQSSQAFAQWGILTGATLGEPLLLQHTAQLPRTRRLTLLDRDDYGVEVQAPTSVLRFVVPGTQRHGLRALLGINARLPHFEAGDLVAIVPPGSGIPRYYSLASASRDGVLEICVRKQLQGLCSEFLHSLSPGDGIDVFIKPNPDFRPAAGRMPVIMIGAGTGIGPLAGFIRHNRSHRPIHLYWGGRDPRSDALYDEQIAACLDDQRLATFRRSFSRMVDGGYVQDGLRDDQETLRELIARGAQIMVCGGREMATGVKLAIDEILVPFGESVGHLKAQGRYLEDVY